MWAQGDVYRRKYKDKIVLNTRCPHPVYSLKLKEVLNAEYSRQKLKSESNFYKIVNKVEQIKIDDENNGNVEVGDNNPMGSNKPTTTSQYDESDYEDNGNSEGLTQGDKLNQIKALKQNQNSPARLSETKQRFSLEKSSSKREDFASESDPSGLLFRNNSRVSPSNVSSTKTKRTVGMGPLLQRSESPRSVYSTNRTPSRNIVEAQMEENGNFPSDQQDRLKPKKMTDMTRAPVKVHVVRTSRKPSTEEQVPSSRSASNVRSSPRKSSAVR